MKGRAIATLAAGVFYAGAALAQSPVYSITPELEAAAKKEGNVVYYTSIDVKVAEDLAKAFEKRYPGIKVHVERNGAERQFSKIGQEYSSKIYNVDTVNSSDASHFIYWKREGWLAAALPEEVMKLYPKGSYDPQGFYAPMRASLSVIAYNTKLVSAADAPKSFKDLLDPKWKGKLVKAHPGYSGTILTATFQTSRDLGWAFFEKLAGQQVMQVQSSTEPPRKVVAGERAVMVDGNEYNVFLEKQKGAPIEVVYATEGSPLVVGPSGVMKFAKNPNAARLFHAWTFSLEAQQIAVDDGGLRSFHPGVKEPAGRKPLKDIKLMKEDPISVDKQVEELKSRYLRYFKT
ncbi:MAG: extracellular solute-binding protein [Alphaproteobacteria bacterium]|nr:extracellular solute-binding protein [Alphaproteobacteria bacterium]